MLDILSYFFIFLVFYFLTFAKATEDRSDVTSIERSDARKGVIHRGLSDIFLITTFQLFQGLRPWCQMGDR